VPLVSRLWSPWESSASNGVTEAAIEAAKSGLSPVIVCVDDEIPALTKRLGDADIDYEMIDLKKG